MSNKIPGRIHFADALRGFALLGIILVHCIEHFDLFVYPESGAVLGFFDHLFQRFIMFTFGGKAYAIFALLFGFSFFIQDNNRLKEGKDFRGRFIWRMVLLAGWGFLNVVFYHGDVLMVFSVVGLSLAAVARLKDKTVLWIAIVLLLQPTELAKIIMGLFNPGDTAPAWMYRPYFERTQPVLESGNFLQIVTMNITSGMRYCHLWYLQSGRMLQIAALFMFGMLIGRRGLFTETEKNTSFWLRAAIIGLPAGLAFGGGGGLNDIFEGALDNAVVMQPLGILLHSLSFMGIMVFLVSAVYLAYYRTRFRKWLDLLAPYGRMSLTMYITQGMLGGFVFYGWGLALAKKLSITQSLGVAMVLFAIQYSFAVLWFRKHRQGPFEWLWKKLTWIGEGSNKKD